jgi:hypothetical protein
MHYGYRRNRRVVIVVVLKKEDTKEVPEKDMGMVTTKDMEEGEANLPLVSIAEKLFMYHGFVPNYVCFVHTATVLNMPQRIVLT